MKNNLSNVNFHTQLNTPEYIKNQRLYAKIEYVSVQTERYGKENTNKFSKAIDYYFECLDKYPEYEKECEKYQKEFTQRTGYENPISRDLYPDHSYAERMSGFMSGYVRNLCSQYFYKSDASHNLDNKKEI